MSKVPTRVLKQGRCTIPAEVRNEHGLEAGDYVLIDVEPLESEG